LACTTACPMPITVGARSPKRKVGADQSARLDTQLAAPLTALSWFVTALVGTMLLQTLVISHAFSTRSSWTDAFIGVDRRSNVDSPPTSILQARVGPRQYTIACMCSTHNRPLQCRARTHAHTHQKRADTQNRPATYVVQQRQQQQKRSIPGLAEKGGGGMNVSVCRWRTPNRRGASLVMRGAPINNGSTALGTGGRLTPANRKLVK
jgi:hypothetical protein